MLLVPDAREFRYDVFQWKFQDSNCPAPKSPKDVVDWKRLVISRPDDVERKVTEIVERYLRFLMFVEDNGMARMTGQGLKGV